MDSVLIPASDNISFKLQAFEGSLELLMHLIEKNKINIFDIPISLILEQYIVYIEQMERENLFITSDFIEMVSKLLYIKSRLLLPKKENEPDPREELIRIILDYKKIKAVADFFLERYETYRNRYEKEPMELTDETGKEEKYEQVLDPALLYEIIKDIINKKSSIPKAEKTVRALTEKKIVTVTEKILFIMRKLYKIEYADFVGLLNFNQQKIPSSDEIVATFVSVLELLKSGRLIADSEDILECSFALNKTNRKKIETAPLLNSRSL